VLGRKCRYCKAPISPRYFIIEFLTGLVFVGVFVLYFRTDLRAGLDSFLRGGWFIYLISITMLSAFIAASAIDMELWVIPLPICWFVTAIGLAGSSVAVFVIEPAIIRGYAIFPSASAKTGALALGAAAGMVISWILLASGLIKRSYEHEESPASAESAVSESGDAQPVEQAEPKFKDRLEICKEVHSVLIKF
jgi:leader peptidase (prepilin peptidase)/N-methyltransferase